MDKHAEEELRVFREFADASGLSIDPNSIDKIERQGMPDISCLIDGDLIFFELTRIADQNFANDMGYRKSSRSADCPPKVNSYSSAIAIREAIQTKAEKTYHTQGSRFDLLIYFDEWVFPDVNLPLMRNALQDLSAVHKDKWETIWFFDQKSGEVLWPED